MLRKIFTFSNFTLLVALSLSAIAAWYSISGLTAIFAGAVIPIIIMGSILELSKIVTTVWLKLYWERVSFLLKLYLIPAVLALALMTSMGIFGFLSKAHSDQSLVSGDVAAKIAVYDEKIKTEKENIEANRKALKQMDEGVDQVLGRSTDEKGADKAVALRRSQQKERTRLQNEISQSQKSIAELNDARAPIAAEVRKVEAEVGPIKYIAAFLYGSNPDASLLEKAVTWVTILIVIVLDPMAVILLLASQYSFQRFRTEEEEDILSSKEFFVADVGEKPTEEEKEAYEQDDGPLTEEQVELIKEDAKEHLPTGVVTTSTSLFPEYQILDDDHEPDHIEQWNTMLAEAEKEIAAQQESKVTHTEEGMVVEDSAGTVLIPESDGYVQNEEQVENNTLWKDISNVTETTYLETARTHMINTFADQVISNTIALQDLPDDIRSDVAHRVSHIQDVEMSQKKDDMVKSLAKQVETGMIMLDQIPENFREAVKAKLNA